MPDDMVGKEGFARYFYHDQRWKFRERGEEEWRWINFHQLAFVPLSGDRVVCTSSDVAEHYRYERYATMSDSDVQDRIITVTRTEWSNNGNDGSQKHGSSVRSSHARSQTTPSRFGFGRATALISCIGCSLKPRAWESTQSTCLAVDATVFSTSSN